eukprot:gene53001-29637_t
MSHVLPYLQGITDLKGDVFEREWRITQSGELVPRDLQASPKKYMILFLQGPEQRINETLRSSIQLKEITMNLPAMPGGHPKVINVPRQNTKEVMIEASWITRTEWDVTVPQDLLDAILYNGMTIEIKKEKATPLGVTFATEGGHETMRIHSLTEKSALKLPGGADLIGMTVTKVNGEWIGEPEDFSKAIVDKEELTLTFASTLYTRRDTIYEVKYSSTRAGAVRFAVTLPEDEATDFVQRMNQQSMLHKLNSEELEIFTWIEEELQSTRAFAINVPNENNKYRAGELNIIAYNNKGVIIKTGGNSATMLIPQGMMIADTVTRIASDSGLTVVKYFQTPSRDASMQRVRVLFAPGDAIQMLPSSSPIRYGERLTQIKIYKPQKRQTADDQSVATSGDGDVRALSQQEARMISEEVFMRYNAERTDDGTLLDVAADDDTLQEGTAPSQQQQQRQEPCPQTPRGNQNDITGGAFGAFQAGGARREQQQRDRTPKKEDEDDTRRKRNEGGASWGDFATFDGTAPHTGDGAREQRREDASGKGKKGGKGKGKGDAAGRGSGRQLRDGEAVPR